MRFRIHNNKGFYVAIFAAILLLQSCKSTKTASTNVAYLPAEEVIKKHYAEDQKFNIKADLLIKYERGSDLISLNGSLRMAKDSAIWISISKLGFPVGKLMVTENRVIFYEKVNKSFFEGDFELLNNWLGIEMNYQMFQNLFLGAALVDLREEKYEVSITENNYLLVQEIEQQERTTASGIIMSVEKYNRKVKIINSGDNKDLKKGDVLLKNMGKGTIVRLDNVEFELIHITDLIAILTEDNG